MADITAPKQVAAALMQASRLLLVGHVSPDGDSLGSLFALQLALHRIGKQADVYVQNGIPEQYRFLPRAETAIADPFSLPQAIDLLVALDCGEWDRLGLMGSQFVDIPIVNIDHHRTTAGMGYVNYIDGEAAATGQLVYDVLEALKSKVDSDIATCLYTALASDTGFFRHANTTAEAHRLAAKLLEIGADHLVVSEKLMTRSREYLGALALLLGRLEFVADGKAVYTWLDQKDLSTIGASANELEGLIDFPRSLAGIEVAAVLMEVSSRRFKVSLRSRCCVDVSELAQEFGGGGHARAAGCTLTGGLSECREQVRAAILRRLSQDE